METPSGKLDSHLRAGIAIYNAGEHHAAHDAWEAHWLDLAQGSDDERFLHGLIQFTAAVFHARNRNWGGATGLAESAQEYLADLPDSYRNVDVAAVRNYLARLESDPECIERQRPLPLTHEGVVVELADLDVRATTVAAHVLAEEYGYDEAVIGEAIEFAERDLAAGEGGSQFVALLFDFVREPDRRAVVFERLAQHVEKRRNRDEDVAGLFDERE